MMKGMLSVILALAMVISYVPMTKAEDSATLGLQVTFDLAPDLRIWSNPEGPFEVKEGEDLVFYVNADGRGVSLGVDENTMPDGATFEDMLIDGIDMAQGLFKWTPDFGQPQGGYEVLFYATQSHYDGTEKTVFLEVGITVLPGDIIAIELEGPEPWVIENIALGGRVSNNGYVGPLHNIKNIGNVPIAVDMGYGPRHYGEIIAPGMEQGVNTFITIVGPRERVLPPDARLGVVKILDPSEETPLALTYGAPTAIENSQDVLTIGHGTSYELRAYKQMLDDTYDEVESGKIE